MTPSSRRNPCPVCGRTKDGDCRMTDAGLVLCHTYQNGTPGSVIKGQDGQDWVYLKHSDEGAGWGVYKPNEPKQPQKEIRPKGKREFIYHDPDDQPVVKVVRTDDGNGEKKFSQSHWTGSRWQSGGISQEVKDRIHLYRIAKARQLADTDRGKRIFLVEGESCVDLLLAMGIPATTSIGGAGKWTGYGHQNYLCDLAGYRVVLSPDCDTKGIAHAIEVAQDLEKNGIPVEGWLLAPPSAPWHNPPTKGGLDVADWIGKGATVDQIWAAVQSEPPPKANINKPVPTTPAKVPPQDSPAGFYYRCREAVFGSERWLSWNGQLYRWNGTHYEVVNPETIQRQVWEFAAAYEVTRLSKDGSSYSVFPFSTPTQVKQAVEWLHLSCTVSEVNPPGINCENGFLELTWQGSQLVPKLSPHSPDRYVLSPPSCRYDPQADPSEYERLMQCLDPASRDIWERTIAASLDLPTVRKFVGRAVKALLLKGDGANGKDTLRAICQQLIGAETFASTSTTDWKAYDNGIYFKVAGLRGKRVSWASETCDIGRIDKLQGLKAAITGDPITFEAKYKDGIKEAPIAVFLFSINEMPNINNSLKAIESRWGIIPFNKTYSCHPKEGELLADPRFKEDPNFIREHILPAFLNRLLVQLQAVVREGIDYSPTQDLLDEISREANHLQQFAQDVGLVYDPNSRIPVQQLWERLEQWYQDNGYLTYEESPKGKKKALWSEPARKGDRLVKGIRLLIPELCKIFPKARRVVEGGHGKPQTTYLQGVVFQDLGTLGTKGSEPLQDKALDPVPKFIPVPNLGTTPAGSQEQPVPKSTQTSTQNGSLSHLGTNPQTLAGERLEGSAGTQSTQSTQSAAKKSPAVNRQSPCTVGIPQAALLSRHHPGIPLAELAADRIPGSSGIPYCLLWGGGGRGDT